MSDEGLIAAGRRTLEVEARALTRVAERLDRHFALAVTLLRKAEGRVIVSGIGKSGLIARKVAATFTSTGTPATFLHPVDCLHGDLGIVSRRDVAIVLSKSGESDELTGLIGALQRLDVPIIAITGNQESSVARVAAVVLDASVDEEACPLDLAPTTSTTVALALGDALAVALLGLKGFSRDDFAALHPGGTLGRKLLLRVRDVMLPVQGTVAADSLMRDVVMMLAHHRGLAIVVSEERVLGVITAGDLTRIAQRWTDFLTLPAGDVMTRTPRTTTEDTLAAAVTGQMERIGIMAMPVLDGGEKLVGVVHLHDLMRAGAI